MRIDVYKRQDLLRQGRLFTSVGRFNGYILLRVGSYDAHSEGKHDAAARAVICLFDAVEHVECERDGAEIHRTLPKFAENSTLAAPDLPFFVVIKTTPLAPREP